MGIYEKLGLFCLSIALGFIYFKADARKAGASRVVKTATQSTSISPTTSSATSSGSRSVSSGSRSVSSGSRSVSTPSASSSAVTSSTTSPSVSSSATSSGSRSVSSGSRSVSTPSASSTSSSRSAISSRSASQRKGLGSARLAPSINQTGRAQYLQQGGQLTVGQILNVLRMNNANANFIVALNANKALINGDPSGSIANSASVGNVDAQSKNLISTTSSGSTLDSIIQQNLNTAVTLKPAASVIQKMLQDGKLDTASKDPYGQILLYFTLDTVSGYNNIWFFVVDPWPPSIVVNKSYPAYDIIEGW